MAVTLVVETGASLATANTWASASEFTAYCNDHGYSLTAYPLADTQAVALILAAEYLRNEDRYAYRGQRTTDTQRLPWPRAGVVVLYGTGVPLASTNIPTALKDAQCELAYRALSAAIQPDLDRGGGVSSVSAGPVSVSYNPNALRETLVQVAQGVLKPYLRRTLALPIGPWLVQDLRTYDDASDPTSLTTLSDGVTG